MGALVALALPVIAVTVAQKTALAVVAHKPIISFKLLQLYRGALAHYCYAFKTLQLFDPTKRGLCPD